MKRMVWCLLVVAACQKSDRNPLPQAGGTPTRLPWQTIPQGTITSGGGDASVAEFHQLAESMMRALCRVQRGYLPRMGTLTPDGIMAQLPNIRVMSSRQPLFQGGIEVDGVHFPHHRRIVFNSDRWARMSLREKRLLVIHEVLGVLGFSEYRYGYTVSLLSRLSSRSVELSHFRVSGAPAQVLLERLMNVAAACAASPSCAARRERSDGNESWALSGTRRWEIRCVLIPGRDRVKFPLLEHSDSASCEVRGSGVARLYLDTNEIVLELLSVTDALWISLGGTENHGPLRLGYVEGYLGPNDKPRVVLNLDTDR